MRRKRFALVSWSLVVFALAFAARVHTQPVPGLDPRAVRQAAVEAGLGSLRNVPVPNVSNLGEFLNPGPEARTDQLVPVYFPFDGLVEPEERSSLGREVLRDTNDVASSQGVFKALFGGVSGGANDRGTPVADDVFNVYGINVRRVEPRNTPNMINAVFNSDNFWDGRARNQFNGVSPFGLLDAKASILVFENAQLRQKKVVIPNSSL